MSVLDGPGEGTWSVFAAKVVEERDELRHKLAGEAEHIKSLEGLLVDAVRERDEARVEVARLNAQLESITAENHSRAQREARSLEEWVNLRAEVEMLQGEGRRARSMTTADDLRDLRDALTKAEKRRHRDERVAHALREYARFMIANKDSISTEQGRALDRALRSCPAIIDIDEVWIGWRHVGDQMGWLTVGELKYDEKIGYYYPTNDERENP
jgi:chromosome segregation ATPase